ncbi:60S acidic ribosomal protein P0 [Pteropus alecto]|uniref:Large ribosomal subunit protein uL10 n=1 Tax=Pteropus alecto TaxID=9402 RepID=L5KF91_PTEAL|nr:60S acidic ribosomal protein P0 [Pteropus alecto]
MFRVSSLLSSCLSLSDFASQRVLLLENSYGPMAIQEKNDFKTGSRISKKGPSFVASADKGEVLMFTGSSVAVVVLIGKSTMMCKAIRGRLAKNPALEKPLPHIKGNVGFVSTKEDLSERKLHSHILESVCNIGSICLQIGNPAVASVPHLIISGYKRVLVLSVETDYTFPLPKKVKAFLADPSAFVAAAPEAAATTAAPAAAAATAEVEAKEELEE